MNRNYMKRNYVLIPLLALVALLAAGAARAESVVTLKPALEVSGDTITLSDLFDGVPVDADGAVARAPAPGTSLTIDPEWLQRRAASLGLDWPNAAGVRRVAIRRLSQTFTAEQVTALVEDELARTRGGDYAVTLSSTQALRAPIDALLAPALTSLSLDPGSSTFLAEVTLAPGLAPARVTGRAEMAVMLPMLARNVARGAILTGDDLTLVATPASRAPADAVGDADAIIGMAARRALRSGLAVRSFDIERPAVIARGDVVVVRFERGPLLLTARARALSDVAEGEQARFVNLQSSRVIEAVASGPGEAWLVASTPMGVVGGQP